MRIGVLGTGTVGRTLASAFAHVGHDVVMGSRSADNPDAAAWVDEQHHAAAAGTFADAAHHGRLLVNATAGAHSLEALGSIPEEDLEGKVLLDVANPLDFSTGELRLTTCNDDSLAEQIQRAHPAVRVVKSLNTVNAGVMVDPASVPGTHVLFLAGDDAHAKDDVRGLLAQLGWSDEQLVDLGALSASRGMEMYLPLWVSMMQALGTASFNIAVHRS